MKVRAHRLLVLLMGGIFTLAACSGGHIRPGVAPDETLEATSSFEYRLGSGDTLRVVVYEQELLSGEFTVDGSGLVSMPLIGGVQAGGLTVREFERAVEEELRGAILDNPQVSAQVTNFRPYYILGEVNDPGDYPYIDGLTVMEAVAAAGGFTMRSDTRRVFIKRAGSISEVRLPLTATTPIRPGDTIRIPERYF